MEDIDEMELDFINNTYQTIQKFSPFFKQLVEIPKYKSYLNYIIRHKMYVYLSGLFHSLNLKNHDASKFLKDEMIAYTNHFYNEDGTSKTHLKDDKGYYNVSETAEDEMELAQMLHQIRNPHHWQYWILIKDDGVMKPKQMSHDYLYEMVSDYIGAGLAQVTTDKYNNIKNDMYCETRNWYSANRNKIIYHPDTRDKFEKIINF